MARRATPWSSRCYERKPQVRVALKKKENRDGSCAYMNRRTQRRQPIKSRVFHDSEYNKAHIYRAILFANAIATSIFGLRSSIRASQLPAAMPRRPMGVSRVIAPMIRRRLMSPLYVSLTAKHDQNGGRSDGMAIPSERAIWVVVPLVLWTVGQLDRIVSWKTDLNR